MPLNLSVSLSACTHGDTAAVVPSNPQWKMTHHGSRLEENNWGFQFLCDVPLFTTAVVARPRTGRGQGRVGLIVGPLCACGHREAWGGFTWGLGTID